VIGRPLLKCDIEVLDQDVVVVIREAVHDQEVQDEAVAVVVIAAVAVVVIEPGDLELDRAQDLAHLHHHQDVAEAQATTRELSVDQDHARNQLPVNKFVLIDMSCT